MKKTIEKLREKISWKRTCNCTCTIYVSIVEELLWNMCRILWGQGWKVLNMRTTTKLSQYILFLHQIFKQNVYCNLFKLIYWYFYIDEHKNWDNNVILIDVFVSSECSNTATFVATKPVRMQEKKQQYKEKKAKWSDNAIDHTKKDESDTRCPRDHGIPCSINSYRRKVLISEVC